MERIISTFGRSFERLRKHPQLVFTIALACLIVASFVFVTLLFASLLGRTQDELTNVRLSSLHDGLVPLVRLHRADLPALSEALREVKSLNATLQQFDFLVADENTPGGYRIAASATEEHTNQAFSSSDFLLSLSATDPRHSFTVEKFAEGERVFETVRAVLLPDGTLAGYLSSVSSQSEADKNLDRAMQKALGALLLVLLLIIVLFLRHSRIIDYASLYRELHELDQLKDDFISMASHELRTPLAVVKGYAELLCETHDIPENARGDIQKIILSVRGLDQLIADILDVSRLESGKIEFRFEDLELGRFIVELSENYRVLTGQKGLEYFADLPSKPIIVRADSEKLKQILTNLVGNAVKYTLKGRVTVSLHSKGTEAEIRITDTGIGIAAGDQHHMFEKFYRVRSEAVRTVQGTGLGLWISRNLIERLGGTLALESIEDVGSHFIVRLPLVVAREGRKAF